MTDEERRTLPGSRDVTETPAEDAVTEQTAVPEEPERFAPPAEPFAENTVNPVPEQPAEPFPENTVNPVPEQPADPFSESAVNPVPEQPADPFAQNAANPLQERTVNPYAGYASDPLRKAQSMPGQPAGPAAADPFANAAQPQQDPVFAASYAQEEKKPQRNTGLAVLLGLMLTLICGFAVFCIVRDVQKGTVSGGYRAGDMIQVELTQQSRGGEKPADTDESGRYTVAGIAKNVMPSIVEIYTYADGQMNGSGSGIILTDDGFIATNAHVVNDASSYTVKLYGEDEDSSGYEATLVGHDTKTDLAVLKIQASGLKPAELGNSDDVQLGETVCALGNPAGLTSSITTGIISGMNRKVRAHSTNFEMDCFQTDAAISPGNSGGALVDLYGRVIGITSSKYGSNSFLTGTAYEGLGFAITVNEAMPIIKELMEQGYVSGRVRIGIQFLGNEDALAEAEEQNKELPKQLHGHGILIVAIADDSDLKNTILEDGNWILAMNGKEVVDYDSVNEAIEGLVGGDSVHCRCGRILDDGTLETFEIDFRLLEDQSGEY